LAQLEEPIRTVALVCVSFGLRISEALGLKWSDVDWLNGTLLIERGIVRQRVGSVKTAESEQKVSADPEMLRVMNSWRHATTFASESDWIFASPAQIGRLPISYPWVWRSFQLSSCEGRYPEVRNAFAAPQLSFLAGRCGNSDCRATEAHAAFGHSHDAQHLRDVVTDEMAQANSKVARMALSKAN
jgi:integrase